MDTLDLDGMDIQRDPAPETESASAPILDAAAPKAAPATTPLATSDEARDAAESDTATASAASEPLAGFAPASGAESDEPPIATPDGDQPEQVAISSAPVRSTDELAVTEPLKSRLAAHALAALAGELEPPNQLKAEPARDPLTPGETLAGYMIERLLRDGPDGPIYLATPAAGAVEHEANETKAARAASEEAPAWRYIAYEVPAERAEGIAGIVKANPRAPGLLAPVAFERVGERAYMIGVELPGAGEHENDAAQPLGGNERLRPVDALTACAQLANSLAALHRAEVAHLHVSPDQVILYDGRVYLAGVEDATLVTNPEEASDLYARDANFLGRTAGALGGANDVTLWDYDSSAQRSLREIAARGIAGGYTTIEEVAEAASLALQVLVVAGASLGADARSVRLRITWGAGSTVGRHRSENQDAWSATLFDLRDDAAADSPLGVFLVADGMGGEAHGEIASRFVARIVSAEMARRFLEPQAAWPALAIFTTGGEDDAIAVPQLPLINALEQAVKEANRRTRAFGARLNATTGSTVTALAVAGARAALAHLGDSRAYLLRDGQLLQLTEDHSLLARLEAMNHPMLEDPNFLVPRSVLYRSVGQEDDVAPDMLQFALAPGDRLMLCSDGLWDEVNDEAIQLTLAAAADPTTGATQLVALANVNGGHDNSTAVVLFVQAEPLDKPFEGVTPEDMPEGRASPDSAESASPLEGADRESEIAE
jgi:serine/threonine protein phosphatase PrpC